MKNQRKRSPLPAPLIVVVSAAAIVSVLICVTQAQALGRKNPMDLNGDGKVVLQELQQMRDRIFIKSDRNKDGVLDRGEFASIQSNMSRPAQGNPPLQESFSALDTNLNGRIARGEFRQGASRMMKAMDTNGDFVFDQRDRKKPWRKPKK